MTKKKLKVVLAYSGGLDTSIILKWLQTEYNAEVVTFTADLGQGEEVEPARRKAEMLGVRPENIFIEDLREEFVRDFVFPMFRANTVYEGQYLLGTSIARPLIANPNLPEILKKADGPAPGKECTYCNKCLINDLANPLGCYELSRFDGETFEKKYEAMIAEVMSVFDPPTFH